MLEILVKWLLVCLLLFFWVVKVFFLSEMNDLINYIIVKSILHFSIK